MVSRASGDLPCEGATRVLVRPFEVMAMQALWKMEGTF
jgi:hypothetical protein